MELDAATQQGAWGSDRGQRYMGAILDREACQVLRVVCTSLGSRVATRREEEMRLEDRIKGPTAPLRGQGGREPAPWWRHTRVLAREHAAQGESHCVHQTGS